MAVKVAFITVTLQHYRLSFYEKLSREKGFEIRVYHGVHQKNDGRPSYSGEVSFANEIFEEHKRQVGPFSVVENRGLMEKVRAFDPDIIVLPGIAGIVTNRRIASWAKRRQKKLIIWSCGWEPGRAKRLLLAMKNHMVSRMFRKGDCHLTYSTKASDYVESLGVAKGLITTCYNGIEIDDLLKNEKEIKQGAKKVREELKLDGKKTFIYVGGLIPEKRIDLLIAAFLQLRKKYDEIRLLIIGDGPERANMLKMLDAANDPNINWLGRIVDGVDAYFAAADCMVLPGIGGLALNQAMIWGKPCIVSEADGTEDDLVIDNKTGFRFRAHKQESLQDAMVRYISLSEEEKAVMSESAKEIILTKSNTNRMVEEFLAAFRRLV